MTLCFWFGLELGSNLENDNEVLNGIARRHYTAEKETVCAHRTRAGALFLSQFLSFWET